MMAWERVTKQLADAVTAGLSVLHKTNISKKAVATQMRVALADYNEWLPKAKGIWGAMLLSNPNVISNLAAAGYKVDIERLTMLTQIATGQRIIKHKD